MATSSGRRGVEVQADFFDIEKNSRCEWGLEKLLISFIVNIPLIFGKGVGETSPARLSDEVGVAVIKGVTGKNIEFYF